MKVIISTHGRFHAFELALGLHQHGALHRLITPYPSWAVKKLTNTDLPLSSAAWIEFFKRISGKAGIGNRCDAFVGHKFGQFAARTDMAGADLFVGWSNASLEAIPEAHKHGLKVVIERGSSHIAHQTDVLKQAYHLIGMNGSTATHKVIERELAEYEQADAITVPSKFAAQTFTERGIPPEKLIVNNYGVDLSRFKSAGTRTERDKARILFVGQIGVRKGIPNLLYAFSKLKDKADLHLVGPIEPGFKSYLRDAAIDGVTIKGPVSGDRLPAIYADADIFCLPSLEEGFPLVNLQALASGCPVITTEAAGAADLIRDGTNGLTVANDSVEQLIDALESLIDDVALRQKMSKAAPLGVQDGFTWDHYVTRAIAAYEKLLS